MQLRRNGAGTGALLALAIALGGCTNVDLDPNAGWFSKPVDFFGRNGGFTFNEFKDIKQRRPITAADLVDANGACPAPAAAAAPSPSAGNPDSAPATPAEPPSLLGAGIALGMTECDIVNRAGAASAVSLGKNPRGERTAVLTYKSGPRPGVYRFDAGRLIDIERVEEPLPEPSKKKPAKPTRQAKKNDNT